MFGKLKKATTAFVVGIILGISTTVSALWLYSDVGNVGTHYGYTYDNQAYLSIDTTGIYGGATIWNRDNSTKSPAGYMGAQGRLYKSNGSICQDSGMKYSTYATMSWGAETNGSGCFFENIYYSKGGTSVFVGSGYITYWTLQTPNANY